jgi:hypothetical protein
MSRESHAVARGAWVVRPLIFVARGTGENVEAGVFHTFSSIFQKPYRVFWFLSIPSHPVLLHSPIHPTKIKGYPTMVAPRLRRLQIVE